MLKKIFLYSKVRATTLLFLAVLLLLSLGSYSDTDPSLNLSTLNEPRNLLGYFGSYLADIFYQLFGNIKLEKFKDHFINNGYILYFGGFKWPQNKLSSGKWRRGIWNLLV
jgi:hypothetical protein